jgi:hypothetical protein
MKLRKVLRMIVGHRPPPPRVEVFSVHVSKDAEGRWQFRTDFTGPCGEGVDVFGALVCHVYGVAQSTNRDGMEVLADVMEMARANCFTVRPDFEGLP